MKNWRRYDRRCGRALRPGSQHGGGVLLLLFNMLDSPCLAAIATMAQQMQSRKWFWFAIIFQNVFAYAVSPLRYQFGTVLAGGPVGVGTIAALAVLIFMLYMLFRPDPYKHTEEGGTPFRCGVV